MRYTLLAALCWQRQREITDTLVELLIHIAHRVRVRAEKKVDGEWLQYTKKVMGKTTLLYKIAKAATGHPDGAVKEVIFPAVSEGTLHDLIQELESDEGYEHRVKLVARASYGHHYRRIVPALLEALSFRCNNERHRPVMDALALLAKYRDHKAAVFPANEKVPLDGVVRDDWQDLVRTRAGGDQPHHLRDVCADGLARAGALQGGVGAGRGSLPQPGRGPAGRTSTRAARRITRPRAAPRGAGRLSGRCAARWPRHWRPSTPACPTTPGRASSPRNGARPDSPDARWRRSPSRPTSCALKAELGASAGR